ncbi:hypothetical protein GH733_009085, partial [Mirounga leonina]
MDFENLFSKPPNPALGKKPTTDFDERIDDGIDDTEVEETQEEKIKWEVKLECEQIPKKVRLSWHVEKTQEWCVRFKHTRLPFLFLAVKQKNKNLKAVQKNGKQKKMKRKWAGAGQKGSNASLRNSGSQEQGDKPKEKQQRVRMSQGFINQHTVERKGKQICKYFLERKCIKGDQCKFDHDAEIEKKKEMCKFYVQGYCTRGENCLYLHNILYHNLFSSLTFGLHEYPCKFYHTGTKCYQGEYCKFSHSPLTPETQELLAKV